MTSALTLDPEQIYALSTRPALTSQECEALLAFAIDTYRELRAANHQEPEPPEPPRPSQVESMEEWAAYLSAHRAHKQLVTERRERIKQAEERQARLIHTWTHFLPTGVWFRSGDLAVGIAYSDWGGSHHYLQVEPWRPDLPSLDHTYRSD